MNETTHKALEAAVAAGLLPPEVKAPTPAGHPWSVVLLTALGAWLAAIPILAAIGIMLEDLLSEDIGPYLIGVPTLAVAVGLLRNRQVPLFVEQLAIPALLVGLGSLAFGLSNHLGEAEVTAVLGALTVILAVVLPRGWLRVLLGFAAGTLLTWALLLALDSAYAIFRTSSVSRTWTWIALHLSLALWLAGVLLQGQLGPRLPAAAAALEPFAAGWLIACLCGLCMLSGMTLLVGATFDPMVREGAGELGAHHWGLDAGSWLRLTSSLCVIAASLWAAYRWEALARAWMLGVAVGIAALAWMLPTLGAVWLALVVTLTTGRPYLSATAAVALAWIIGSFYYQLQWTLAQKALVLGAVGLGLGLLVWLEMAGSRHTGPARPRRGIDWGIGTLLIVLTTVSVLGVANWQIWTKERLIATGRKVYVKLMPVDPRSLMQGDYMRLRFAVPGGLDSSLPHLSATRPRVVARLDERGVATLLHVHKPGSPLGEHELLMTLTAKNGRWTLVTDAWFFREGDGERWQAARYGEFRVEPDGDALLVGMADADLRAILPGTDTDDAGAPDR